MKYLTYIFAALMLISSVHAEETVTKLNFGNPTKIEGNGRTSAKLYYTNVAEDIDAIVEAITFTNARIDEVDMDFTGELDAFQPRIKSTIKGVGESSITWRFTLVEAGTETPIDAEGLSFQQTAVDVDGDGSDLREFVMFSNYSRYTMDATSILQAEDYGESTRFMPTKYYSLPEVTFNDTNSVIVYFEDINTWTYTSGINLEGTNYKPMRWFGTTPTVYEFTNPVDVPEEETECTAMIDLKSTADISVRAKHRAGTVLHIAVSNGPTGDVYGYTGFADGTYNTTTPTWKTSEQTTDFDYLMYSHSGSTVNLFTTVANGRDVPTQMGPFQNDNGTTLVTTELDPIAYLNDSVYKAYAKDTVVVRQELMVISSDDGFAYGIKSKTGDVVFGFMPSQLVDLTADENYWTENAGNGMLKFVDAKGTDGYGSYLVGTVRGGKGLYILELTTNDEGLTTPSSVVYEGTFESGNADFTVFKTPNGGKAIAYTAGNNLVIRDVATGTVIYQTTTDKNGDVTTASLDDGDRSIFVVENGVVKQIDLYVDGSLDNTPTTATTSAFGTVEHVSIRKSFDDEFFMVTQTDEELVINKLVSGTWELVWYVNIDEAGLMVDGSLDTTADIYGLTGNITDKIAIAADTIVVPVEVMDDVDNCYGSAYYHFYKLQDGSTVDNVKINNKPVVDRVKVGLGEAYTPQLSHPNKGKSLVLYGRATQSVNGGVPEMHKITMPDVVKTGIRSWRLVY